MKAEIASDPRTSLDKPLGKVEMIDTVPSQNVPQFYASGSKQEQELDRSINLKLDCIILPILALDFMVCSRESLF